jgi:hypothetical protein
MLDGADPPTHPRLVEVQAHQCTENQADSQCNKEEVEQVLSV